MQCSKIGQDAFYWRRFDRFSAGPKQQLPLLSPKLVNYVNWHFSANNLSL